MYTRTLSLLPLVVNRNIKCHVLWKEELHFSFKNSYLWSWLDRDNYCMDKWFPIWNKAILLCKTLLWNNNSIREIYEYIFNFNSLIIEKQIFLYGYPAFCKVWRMQFWHTERSLQIYEKKKWKRQTILDSQLFISNYHTV